MLDCCHRNEVSQSVRQCSSSWICTKEQREECRQIDIWAEFHTKAVGKQLMYENPTRTTEWERSKRRKANDNPLESTWSLSLLLILAWHSPPVSSSVINILPGKDYDCHLYAIFTQHDWFKPTIIVCLSFSVWLFCLKQTRDWRTGL